MKTYLFLLPACFLCCPLNAQVSINSLGMPGVYSENFSGINTTGFGADNTANTWSDNVTLPGWYLSNETSGSFIYNSTLTTTDNTGRNYVFNLAGDKSIGFRASGTSPNDNLFAGLRLLNNTGSVVTSFYLTYYGEQWTIAENGNPPGPYNINQLSFSYQQGATVTSVLAGTFTPVSALDFIQIHSCTLAVCTGNSNQRVVLDGNLASNRTQVTGCVDVNIPAGQEIMLRWQDSDNSMNDHHLQIDNVSVSMYAISCITVLPVDLLRFDALQQGNDHLLRWETASEYGLGRYVIEHSLNGLAFEDIAEVNPTNSPYYQGYEILHKNPVSGTHYYRLKAVNQDGTEQVSAIKAIAVESNNIHVWVNVNNEIELVMSNEESFNRVLLYDLNGKICLDKPIDHKTQSYSTGDLSAGFYILKLLADSKTVSRKIYLGPSR